MPLFEPPTTSVQQLRLWGEKVARITVLVGMNCRQQIAHKKGALSIQKSVLSGLAPSKKAFQAAPRAAYSSGMHQAL